MGLFIIFYLNILEFTPLGLWGFIVLVIFFYFFLFFLTVGRAEPLLGEMGSLTGPLAYL